MNSTTASINGDAHVSANVVAGTPFFSDIFGTDDLRGVSVEAESPKEVYIFSVGGSVGSDAGIAGSFSVTVIDDTTEAYIKAPSAVPLDNAGIFSDGSVTVVATSDLFLVGAAGAVAAGSSAGVGVGADIGVATVRTRAYIGEGAEVVAEDSIFVQAVGQERGVSVSASGAGSGMAAVGVTAGVSVLVPTTEAYIANNAIVTADGNVVVQAQDSTLINVITGNISVGANAAVGIAGGVSVINKSTESYIASGAQVTARALDGNIVANTGGFVDVASDDRSQQESESKGFLTQNVDSDANSIEITGHDLADGDEIIYTAAAQAIRGLRSGRRYYVIVVDDDHVKLTDSPDGPALDLSAEDGLEAAAEHSLDTIVGVGLPSLTDNENFDPSEILTSSGSAIGTAQRGVVVSAVSINEINSAGIALGARRGHLPASRSRSRGP